MSSADGHGHPIYSLPAKNMTLLPLPSSQGGGRRSGDRHADRPKLQLQSSRTYVCMCVGDVKHVCSPPQKRSHAHTCLSPFISSHAPAQHRTHARSSLSLSLTHAHQSPETDTLLALLLGQRNRTSEEVSVHSAVFILARLNRGSCVPVHRCDPPPAVFCFRCSRRVLYRAFVVLGALVGAKHRVRAGKPPARGTTAEKRRDLVSAKKRNHIWGGAGGT